MRDTAISHLATLHRQTGRTVQLGVMRGHEVVFLERLSVEKAPSTLFGVGGRRRPTAPPGQSCTWRMRIQHS
jgi:DNA-binding IclR family transcriptional regulator